MGPYWVLIGSLRPSSSTSGIQNPVDIPTESQRSQLSFGTLVRFNNRYGERVYGYDPMSGFSPICLNGIRPGSPVRVPYASRRNFWWLTFLIFVLLYKFCHVGGMFEWHVRAIFRCSALPPSSVVPIVIMRSSSAAA